MRWPPPTPGLWYLNIQYAEVLTAQARNNAAYGDLATVGPQVTVQINASGIALCFFSAHLNAAGLQGWASLSVDGATPTDAQALVANVGFGGAVTDDGRMGFRYVSGLTAGAHTFKLQYRTVGGSVTFKNRKLIVLPL